MNKQKMILVMTNIFHRLGQAIIITIGWIIGFEVVVSLLGLAFNHNLASFLTALQRIPSTLTGFITLILLAYSIVTPYVDFKWAIQNGISRKTMWRGRSLALLLVTLVIFILDELLSTANRLALSPRTLLVNFLILLTGVVTCQAIGNGFGLLNRRWKWIVGIGLPITGLLLISMLTNTLAIAGNSGLLIGYQHNHLVGILPDLLDTPIVPYVFWLIYFVVVLGLTKLFNDHMQLRRD